MAMPYGSYAAPAGYGYPSSYGMSTMPTTTVAAPTMSYGAPSVTMPAMPATTSYTAAPAMSYNAPSVTMPAMPATYGAPAMPTMTSYAAPATTSYAAPPATTSYAAPPMSYAAPMPTTMAPSFVAPPAMPAMGMGMPQMGLQPPVSLTAGLPTPEQVLQQKKGYAMALDKQLKEATDTVVKENAIEKEMLKFNAAKNVALYESQMDEQLTEQLATTEEQATILQCELKKALVDRNLQLNQTASDLLMDYNMKALMTECSAKNYAFQQQYGQQMGQLAQQYGQQAMQAAGYGYAAPAAATAATGVKPTPGAGTGVKPPVAPVVKPHVKPGVKPHVGAA